MSEKNLNTVTVHDKVANIETTITVTSSLSVSEILSCIREHQAANPEEPVNPPSEYATVFLGPDDAIEEGDEYWFGDKDGWVPTARVGEKRGSINGDYRRKVKVWQNNQQKH